jgi:ComF family protein
MSLHALPNPFRGLVSLIYPPFCAVCAGAISSDEYLCESCAQNLLRIRPPYCAKCSEPFAGALTSSFTCANCADRRLYFEAAVSSYRSRGAVREVVHRFKYGRQIHLRRLLGLWVAEALDDSRLVARHFDLVVPVPLHPARQRERGFNQAALLAAALRRSRNLPVCNVLQRTRYTATQTQFDRNERMENLRGAFRLRRGSNVQDLRMLLVDDVLTTGSTLSECASVLLEAGALSVHAVTAARG